MTTRHQGPHTAESVPGDTAVTGGAGLGTQRYHRDCPPRHSRLSQTQGGAFPRSFFWNHHDSLALPARAPGRPDQEEIIYALGYLLFSPFLFYSNMRVSLVVRKEKLFNLPLRPGIKAIRNHGSGVLLKEPLI